jgi:chorismate synthase
MLSQVFAQFLTKRQKEKVDMGSNTFGQLFQITTWGESHGRGVGVVIDGCPANLPLSEKDLNDELEKRQGGKTAYTTPRKEKDAAVIYSGVFEGKTTGAPLSIFIENKEADSSKYHPIEHLFRPGHANFTYLKKYGIFDYRGGGRASARETVSRVAAGAVAKKVLSHFKIDLTAYIREIGGIEIQTPDLSDLALLKKTTYTSPIFCPDEKKSLNMIEALTLAKKEKDSLGGIIECVATNFPPGVGDPVYEKLEANLAKAMMTLPATKGFEIGSGFSSARMKGSEHNDLFFTDHEGRVRTKTNHAGGILGGISTGMPLIFRVAFKPTSSIAKSQMTVSRKGGTEELTLPEGSRHDPCVAIRAVPIVEAMAAIVLADRLLVNRSAQL